MKMFKRVITTSGVVLGVMAAGVSAGQATEHSLKDPSEHDAAPVLDAQPLQLAQFGFRKPKSTSSSARETSDVVYEAESDISQAPAGGYIKAGDFRSTSRRNAFDLKPFLPEDVLSAEGGRLSYQKFLEHSAADGNGLPQVIATNNNFFLTAHEDMSTGLYSYRVWSIQTPEALDPAHKWTDVAAHWIGGVQESKHVDPAFLAHSVALSPDGSVMAFAREDSKRDDIEIVLMSTSDGRRLDEYSIDIGRWHAHKDTPDLHEKPLVKGLSFSPTAPYLAVFHNWSPESKDIAVNMLIQHPGKITILDLKEDEIIASSAPTPGRKDILPSSGGAMFTPGLKHFTYSHDGRYLVTHMVPVFVRRTGSTYDHSVRYPGRQWIYDAQSLELLDDFDRKKVEAHRAFKTFEAYEKRVTSWIDPVEVPTHVAFSGDGKYFALSSTTLELRSISPEEQKDYEVIDTIDSPTNGTIEKMTASRDGSHVFIWTRDEGGGRNLFQVAAVDDKLVPSNRMKVTDDVVYNFSAIDDSLMLMTSQKGAVVRQPPSKATLKARRLEKKAWELKNIDFVDESIDTLVMAYEMDPTHWKEAVKYGDLYFYALNNPFPPMLMGKLINAKRSIEGSITKETKLLQRSVDLFIYAMYASKSGHPGLMVQARDEMRSLLALMQEKHGDDLPAAETSRDIQVTLPLLEAEIAAQAEPKNGYRILLEHFLDEEEKQEAARFWFSWFSDSFWGLTSEPKKLAFMLGHPDETKRHDLHLKGMPKTKPKQMPFVTLNGTVVKPVVVPQAPLQTAPPVTGPVSNEDARPSSTLSDKPKAVVLD